MIFIDQGRPLETPRGAMVRPNYNVARCELQSLGPVSESVALERAVEQGVAMISQRELTTKQLEGKIDGYY